MDVHAIHQETLSILTIKTATNIANYVNHNNYITLSYRGAGKSLARPGRKQATATEDFDVHISYL